jgi:delta1-piperideine-2-carboxylate reductase
MTTIEMELGEICDLAQLVLLENGCDRVNTGALVRTIYLAERDGCAAHGLFRVPGYVAALRSGKVNGKADPKVNHKTPVIVSVHGDGGFAPLALDRGVPVLAEAAKTYGVAVMAMTHAHHFAALSPEVEKLAAEGLIGMACVNYVPVMAPAGGTKPIFGTNPLAIAWPRPGRDPVVLDMATSAMSRGEVTIAARDGKSVPLGTGLDVRGKPTTDPNEVLKGVMLPFGGHKGSGLALMVELLAAAAVGERFSFETAAEDNKDGGPPRGGEFVLALSPDLMAGSGWAAHAEGFFAQFDAIVGARLPGARRMKNRKDYGPRKVDAALVEKIKGLA